MSACKFTKKTLSHILFHVFYLHLLRMYHDYFFQKGFESARVQFLSAGSIVLLGIYLFNHDSSKSTIFMLNMAFDILLSAIFVKYSKLESLVSCNVKLLLYFNKYFFYKQLIILHHGDKTFLFWHLNQIHTFNTDRGRNDNVSLDVC